MKKLLLVSTLLISIIYVNQAKAGFYIDPALGMHITDAEVGTTDDLSGMGFGTKVGWKTLGLSFGVDYQTVNLESDSSNFEVDTTEIGLFLGYDLPILFRFWVSYAVSLSGDIANTTTDYDSGSGTKIGIGYTGLPLLSINLEIKSYNFDENSAGATIDQDYNATFLSISFPFSI
jgi:hypothetical protein